MVTVGMTALTAGALPFQPESRDLRPKRTLVALLDLQPVLGDLGALLKLRSPPVAVQRTASHHFSEVVALADVIVFRCAVEVRSS